MWKRDEAVKPTSGQSTPTGSVVPSQGSKSASPPPDARQQIGRDVVNIGKSVVMTNALANTCALILPFGPMVST